LTPLHWPSRTTQKIGCLALAVTVAIVGDVRGEEEKTETPERSDVQENVSVVLDESPRAPLGSSSTSVAPDKSSGNPTNLTDLVIEVPGVSENGQGGLFQVYSIRGVSRQRVMSLVSGMRVTSDRRAGVSTSFIDPTLMQSAEVLRGPTTTFYGSGALGGVVEVAPREFAGWSFGAGYDTVGDENYQTVGAGGENWSVGVSRRSAGDAESADGTLLNSHFTQHSAVARVSWGRRGYRYELIAIPTYGKEIGKANTDFPVRTTNYPVERHALVKFSVNAASGWSLEAYVHPQDLETEVVEQETRSEVSNDSVDFGVRWTAERPVGTRLVTHFGADGFGRRDVDAAETQFDLSVPDQPTSQTARTLDGATETELGAWGSVRWTRTKTRWEFGARYSWLTQSNSGDPTRDRSAWSGYAGVSRDLGNKLEFRASLSSGIRFPSLSELYYTGTTGRGQVIGNPELIPERSLGAEASLRWATRRVVVTGVIFHNEIDDYIERIGTDLLSFINETSGTIQGLELHGVSRLTAEWTLDFGGHAMRGEDSGGRPLADTPPDEIFLGGAYETGRWSVDARLAWRAARDRFASGEKPIPSATLLSATVRYRWAARWEAALSGTNMLDQSYFRSADRKAPMAAGRGIGIGIAFRDAPR
jgi:outer membrane receptor protein involved in Fe transport